VKTGTTILDYTDPEQGPDRAPQLRLDFHLKDREAEAWSSWDELPVSPLEGRAGGDDFHLRLLVPERLLEGLAQPDWRSHPQAPRRGERLPLTPGMRVSLESLRRCPFSGPSRELFQSARRNDLLLGFAELLRQRLERPRTWSNQALESRIREAADILGRELDCPPTLERLARRVGLSESSLKRGFRDYCGDTVFGLLRRLRMRRARELLERGEATVMEASLRVGYSNPSNFAAAFRAEYGMNPKEFQLSLRDASAGPDSRQTP